MPPSYNSHNHSVSHSYTITVTPSHNLHNHSVSHTFTMAATPLHNLHNHLVSHSFAIRVTPSHNLHNHLVSQSDAIRVTPSQSHNHAEGLQTSPSPRGKGEDQTVACLICTSLLPLLGPNPHPPPPLVQLRLAPVGQDRALTHVVIIDCTMDTPPLVGHQHGSKWVMKTGLSGS